MRAPLLLRLWLLLLPAAFPGCRPHDAAPGPRAPASNAPEAQAARPVLVSMETSLGTIELELYPDKAPLSVQNFLHYAEQGHYNGTVFHRVIPKFMIQGGGLTPDLKERPTESPIKNEADNGLKNERGSLAMARTGDPDSATAQFFINVMDNPFLDRDQADDGVGYAVFGKVTQGMDVVDKIVNVPTTGRRGMQDVPVEPVVILSVKLEQPDAKSPA